MATASSHKRMRHEARANAEADTSNVETPGGLTPSSFAAAALVLGGIALLQPELIPGMAIGAAVALFSGSMPNLAAGLRPMAKAAVRAAYNAAEVIAEATEEIQDLVAEARAEHENPPSSGEEQHEPHITH